MTAFTRPAWRLGPLALVTVAVLVACAPASEPAATTPAAAGTPSPTEEATETAEPTGAVSPVETEEAAGQALITVAESAALGSILADAEGRTLYLFTNDSPEESACTGDCAANWPPLTVESEDELVADEGVTGELATITRDDGSLQATINGHPLYYYAADAAPGDTNGQGVGGVWFAVTPSGEQVP